MEEKERITSERIDGPTPSGGAYAIGYYMNDGIAVSKEEATQMIIKEYNDQNIVIKTTYGNFMPPKPKTDNKASFML